MSEDNYEAETDDEDLDEVNQKCIDEDAEYEKYRDDAGDMLEEELDALLKKFNDKEGYYHNSIEKLIQHCIVHLEFKLKLETDKQCANTKS